MQIYCLPARHPLSQGLIDLASIAVERLEMAQHLVQLVFSLDDLTADERVWLSFGRVGAKAGPPARSLTIYLHPDQLIHDKPPETSFLIGIPLWQSRRISVTATEPQHYELFRPKVERFLYHQLLSVRDLCEGRIDPADIPTDLAEAFQEIWAITVDGRLRRALLPGYSAAERRQRFSRVFARGGVLLPVHWDLFHRLWQQAEPQQGELQKLARRLPRLHRRG